MQEKDVSIKEYIDSYAQKIPHIPAVIVAGQSITWHQLQKKIELFSAEISALNPRRLLIYFSNFPLSMALVLACERIFIETIIVSDYYPINTTINLMNQFSGSHLITLEESSIKIIKEISSAYKEVTDNQPSTLCILTSGTTGTPKCVRHSWRKLCDTVKHSSKFIGKKWLMGYPMTHFAGLQVVFQTILNEGTLIIPSNFNPNVILHDLSNFQVDYLNCTPTLMRQLLLSVDANFWQKIKLKSITLGGEIVDQSLIDLIKKHLPDTRIIHIYASTELGALITVKDEQEGFPLSFIDGLRFKIDSGQLFVKPHVNRAMLGYLNGNSLLTDVWIGTKDKVEIIENRVKFLGRIDDTINLGGYKVDPYAIERVIREFDGVLEVAVIPQSNPIVGNMLKAKIQIKEGLLKSNLKQKILDHCKSKLPYYMVPRLLEFLETIDTTHTMKILRRENS